MTTRVPAASNQEQRRAALRKWRGFALGLLLCAAAIFLGCSWWQSTPGGAPAWVGFVRAAAEAGMVGGLADWFAVTAIFRHPLGLPIPHTALVPNKKDQVGEALSDFVEENFLTPEALSAKVHEAEIPLKAATWAVEPGHPEQVSEYVGSRAARMVGDIDPKEAEEFIKAQVIDRLAEPDWGPPLGRMLEGFIAEGKARPLEDDLIAWAHKKILGMEHSVVTTIDERMPRWAPRFARELVGDKVYRELVAFAEEVEHDPNHEARLAIRRNLSKAATDLQWDPDLRARVEGLKQELLESSHVAAAPAAMWEVISASIIEQLEQPDSFLRTKLADKVSELAHKVLEDPATLERANEAVDKAARYAAEHFASDVVSIIPETIKRWDATEASENIELMVGKDLQFIRVNGTVVGALAGLAIYTVNQAFF